LASTPQARPNCREGGRGKKPKSGLADDGVTTTGDVALDTRRCARLLAPLGALVFGAALGTGCEHASAANTVKASPTQNAPNTSGATTPAAAAKVEANAGKRREPKPAGAGQVVSVPAGTVWLGSVPGTVNRDPSREADHVAFELPAFSIDRLPYPNDPALPPLTNVTRDEAAGKCSEVGKRLCTEQEWERACEGDDDAEFPMGAIWQAATCDSDRVACDSQLGVSELGLLAREWTASEAPSGIGVSTRTAVTRGSTRDALGSEHRCSARNAATPDSRSDSIGFRCCQGEATASAYPTDEPRPLVVPLELSTEGQREVLKSVPALAEHAESFTPMSGTDTARALARGGRGADNLTWWTLAPSAFTWSPMTGEQILVMTGHVKDGGVLLAALYPHEGKYLHGASTLLYERDSSVVVASREDSPTSLLWTSCWGCFGEGGSLRLGSDNRVTFDFH